THDNGARCPASATTRSSTSSANAASEYDYGTEPASLHSASASHDSGAQLSSAGRAGAASTSSTSSRDRRSKWSSGTNSARACSGRATASSSRAAASSSRATACAGRATTSSSRATASSVRGYTSNATNRNSSKSTRCACSAANPSPPCNTAQCSNSRLACGSTAIAAKRPR